MLNGDALTHQAVPCRLGEYALLLIDTGRSRPGSASRWNERLDQCHRALKMLQQESSLQSLCELTPDRFQQQAHLISDADIAARARHVIEENARVQRAAEALQKGELELFGQILTDSHTSLRQLYEIPSREQDLVVEISQHKGVAGARMTGVGGGGSVLVLVHQAALKNYRNHMFKEYKNVNGAETNKHRIRTGNGAHRLTHV